MIRARRQYNVEDERNLIRRMMERFPVFDPLKEFEKEERKILKCIMNWIELLIPKEIISRLDINSLVIDKINSGHYNYNNSFIFEINE